MKHKDLYIHALVIFLLVAIVTMLVRPGSQGPVLVSGFGNALADMISYTAA